MKVGFDAMDRRADPVEARVRWLAGKCVDENTQVLLTDQVMALAKEWRGPVGNVANYTRAENTYQNPVIGYPADLQEQAVFGAVLLLVMIEADGNVHDTRAVCATHSAFIPYARANIVRNRYRPSTIGGVPVRDVAFLPVVFNPFRPLSD